VCACVYTMLRKMRRKGNKNAAGKAGQDIKRQIKSLKMSTKLLRVLIYIKYGVLMS
jgi:hypothetical protein